MATRTKFKEIYRRAAKKKGGEQALAELMPDVASEKELAATSSDRFLSAMTSIIFKAGFSWKVVDKKWDGFESAFHGFDVGFLAMLPEDEYDRFLQDERIIRNRMKVKSIRANAQFLDGVERDIGPVGEWIAEWPTTDISSLWTELKKKGSRLGGMSGPYFLRTVGKDTFLLTRDVSTALVNAGVVDRAPSTKKEIAAAQATFNEWSDETGKPLSHLSRILAASID